MSVHEVTDMYFTNRYVRKMPCACGNAGPRLEISLSPSTLQSWVFKGRFNSAPKGFATHIVKPLSSPRADLGFSYTTPIDFNETCRTKKLLLA